VSTARRKNWHGGFRAPEVTLAPDGREHVVQFYEDDVYLVDLVARFLGVGLVGSEPLVALVTEPHRHAVCERLATVGFDVDAAIHDGQLRFEDPHVTLERVMAGGMPDADRVRILMGGILRETRTGRYGRKRTRVFGEIVDVLWRRGDQIAAIRLEELWNGLQCDHPFHLLCTYCMDSTYRETHATSIHQIHKAHSRVLTDVAG
jgi:hypothetical protein